MLAIPNTVFNQYDAVLRSLMVPISQYADYKKWLRYFLDFCAKYPANNTAAQMRLFLEKLREKRQSEEQRQQEACAINLYIGIQEQVENEWASGNNASVVGEDAVQYASQDAFAGLPPQSAAAHSGSSHYCDAGYHVKSASPEWDAVLDTMAGEIKVPERQAED